MEEPDPRHVAEGLWRALQAGDWEAAGGYLHDYDAQPFQAPAWRAQWVERT